MVTTLLNMHLQQKIANRQWVETCLNGKAESFPHCIKDGGKASFGNEDLVYDPNVHPTGDLKGKPVYVVNIPCAFQNMKADPGLLHHLIHLFERESAGINGYHAKCFAKSRFALVIGVNRPHSIDPSKNHDLRPILREKKLVSDVAFRILGFYWYPAWETTLTAKHLLPKEKSYLCRHIMTPSAPTKIIF
jgi:hypothetical protein